MLHCLEKDSHEKEKRGKKRIERDRRASEIITVMSHDWLLTAGIFLIFYLLLNYYIVREMKANCNWPAHGFL